MGRWRKVTAFLCLSSEPSPRAPLPSPPGCGDVSGKSATSGAGGSGGRGGMGSPSSLGGVSPEKSSVASAGSQGESPRALGPWGGAPSVVTSWWSEAPWGATGVGGDGGRDVRAAPPGPRGAVRGLHCGESLGGGGTGAVAGASSSARDGTRWGSPGLEHSKATATSTPLRPPPQSITYCGRSHPPPRWRAGRDPPQGGSQHQCWRCSTSPPRWLQPPSPPGPGWGRGWLSP